MRSLSGYVLSSEAYRDIVDIFDYTYEEFGIDQVNFYLSEMENLFFLLVKTL